MHVPLWFPTLGIRGGVSFWLFIILIRLLRRISVVISSPSSVSRVKCSGFFSKLFSGIMVKLMWTQDVRYNSKCSHSNQGRTLTWSRERQRIPRARAFAGAVFVNPHGDTITPCPTPVSWHFFANPSSCGTPTGRLLSRHSTATRTIWCPDLIVKTTSCSRNCPVDLSRNRLGDSTFTISLLARWRSRYATNFSRDLPFFIFYQTQPVSI